MQRALILAYWFPPVPPSSESGARRPEGLARFLGEFGWEPIVLTATPGNEPYPWCHVERVPSRSRVIDLKHRVGIGGATLARLTEANGHARSAPGRRAVVAAASNAAALYPDSYPWLRPAGRAVDELVRRFSPAAIISTSKPETTHLLARRAARQHGLPWIADLRDLWSDNPHYIYASLRRRLERSYEKRVLGDAAALTTVAPSLAEAILAVHGPRPVRVIPNGFDPALLTSTGHPNGRFDLVYTGRFYTEHGNADIFFRGLEAFVRACPDARDVLDVRFYGPRNEGIATLAREAGVEELVRQCGYVPRHEAVSAQKSAQLLVHVCRSDGGPTGKLYEYIASGRPILSVGREPNGARKIVRDTNTGRVAVSPEEVTRVLVDAYGDFRQLGIVRYDGRANRVARYSQREMARSFAALLDEVRDDAAVAA